MCQIIQFSNLLSYTPAEPSRNINYPVGQTRTFISLFTASVQLWLPAKTDSLSDLLCVWSVTKTAGWRLLSLTWGRYHWLLSLTISRELVGQKETLCKTLVRRNPRLTRMSMLTEGQRDWPVLYATQTWAIKLACKKSVFMICFLFLFISGFPPVTLLRTP